MAGVIFPAAQLGAGDRDSVRLWPGDEDGAGQDAVLLAAANLLSLDEQDGPVAAVFDQRGTALPLFSETSRTASVPAAIAS